MQVSGNRLQEGSWGRAGKKETPLHHDRTRLPLHQQHLCCLRWIGIMERSFPAKSLARWKNFSPMMMCLRFKRIFLKKKMLLLLGFCVNFLLGWNQMQNNATWFQEEESKRGGGNSLSCVSQAFSVNNDVLPCCRISWRVSDGKNSKISLHLQWGTRA